VRWLEDAEKVSSGLGQLKGGFCLGIAVSVFYIIATIIL
jgi:hypothetical protein